MNLPENEVSERNMKKEKKALVKKKDHCSNVLEMCGRKVRKGRMVWEKSKERSLFYNEIFLIFR